jgi:hypothetical protein
VTLRARWVTLRARWVTRSGAAGDLVWCTAVAALTQPSPDAAREGLNPSAITSLTLTHALGAPAAAEQATVRALVTTGALPG